MEINKNHVKYEANASELACDELNLALLSANLKAYLLKIKLNRFTYLLSANNWVNNVMTSSLSAMCTTYEWNVVMISCNIYYRYTR